MGGGLMQLVAYGAQDIYLTGNPQITFFKVVYRRHTNFSMEAIEQTMNGTYSAGGRQSVTVSRNGDLINRMWIQQVITSSTDWSLADPGYNQFGSVELEIGGQLIDKHYGHWMNAWAQLTEVNQTGLKPTDTSTAIAVGTWTLFQKMALAGGIADNGSVAAGGTHFIPLQFWFCRNPGLALPLIALQYHEVKLYLNWSSVEVSTGVNQPVTTVWCDYIYLDTDERRRFAQVSHEYLIEQVQYQSYSTGSVNKELNFNHPVKELVWTGVLTAGLATALTSTYKLKLNGHDRFAARNFKYFTNAQVWQHHTGYGGVTAIDSIGVYSFALKPEEHQPSGTCNFSRIDNAQLVQGSDAAINVYAVNYNVLRIMSGMGGLAYSN
jgi:hypothetical protein